MWGAAKGVAWYGIAGAAKGAVAAADVAYEAAAPKIMSAAQQTELQARVSIGARSAAREIAPLLGAVGAAFCTGAVEGEAAAGRSMASLYDKVVPEDVQRELEARIEERLGGLMQHVLEPATEEFARRLYTGSLKPRLTTDKRMPAAVRLYHESSAC